MKKIFLLGMLAFICLIGGTMNHMNLTVAPQQILQQTQVSLQLVEGSTVTAHSLQLEITNHTNEELVYGVGYEIEVAKKDTWYTIDVGPIAVILLAITLPAHGHNTEDIDWAHTYGALPAGTYRLVKMIGPYRTGVEFSIR